MPKQTRKTLILSIYFILAVSTLLVFWQVHSFGFADYDDDDYVSENPYVLNGLTAGAIRWAFTTGYAGNWHPLTWLSLMFDCQLFSPNPGMIHLVNVFFHLANTLLLFSILKKMTGALWPSVFVAAAFALHPMHVESVAWITERKDVLSTFFWMLTMWAYAYFVSRPKIWRYLLVVIFFALGLMAKPMLVTLPFVLLLLDYWPLNRIGCFNRKIIYSLVWEKMPFFALTVVSSIITFLVQRRSGAVVDINFISLDSRIANIFLSYAKYIGKMFWPCNLAVFYPFNIAARFPFWQAAMCALLLFIISVFVLCYGRSQKYLPVGWFWFVGTLIPVIGIVQVGLQAYADRYTYIPYIGLFIMLAWLLSQLLSKWPQRKIALGLLMLLVLTTLGICAHRQTSRWSSGEPLFLHALAVTKNNFVAYNGLGVVYSDLGRLQESIEAYQQAIKIKPDYVDAYINLGNSYEKLGRYQEEIDVFRKAVKINPNYAMAYYNLGLAYGNIGRSQEAINAFKQAVKINPNHAESHYNLGVAYGQLNRSDEEIDAYRQAIRIKPDYAEAYNNLGITYSSIGRFKEAIDAFKQAIRVNSHYTEAHVCLGYTYLTTGDKKSALAEYKILKTLDAQMAENLLNQINK
jgi:tetratricopeptide (TPR) repeat protein